MFLALLFVLTVNGGVVDVFDCAWEKWWWWDDNTCDCGNRLVRIGRDNQWSEWQEQASNTVACHTDNLGDPAPGTQKKCQCGRQEHVTGPCENTWESCIAEQWPSPGMTCDGLKDAILATKSELCATSFTAFIPCGGDADNNEALTFAELCPNTCDACSTAEDGVGSGSELSKKIDLHSVEELMMKTQEVNVGSEMSVGSETSVGGVVDVFDCAWEKWWWWDDNTCDCGNRLVRIGRDDKWSDWQEQSSDSVACHTDNLGDPAPGTQKKCQCGRQERVTGPCENTWEGCMASIWPSPGMTCDSLVSSVSATKSQVCGESFPAFIECGGDPENNQALTVAELCPDACDACPSSSRTGIQSYLYAESVSGVRVPEAMIGGLALIGLATIGYLAYRSCSKQSGDYVNVVANQEV